jgi:hypothetical protein
MVIHASLGVAVFAGSAGRVARYCSGIDRAFMLAGAMVVSRGRRQGYTRHAGKSIRHDDLAWFTIVGLNTLFESAANRPRKNRPGPA